MEMGRDALSAASTAVERLDAFHRRMSASDIDLSSGETMPESIDAFTASMNDDFGTPAALDQAFSLVREANSDLDNGKTQMAGLRARTALTLLTALGIEIGAEESILGEGPDNEEIERLIEERQKARSDRDFDAADQIRDQLAASGIVVEDTADGVIWHRA